MARSSGFFNDCDSIPEFPHDFWKLPFLSKVTILEFPLSITCIVSELMNIPEGLFSWPAPEPNAPHESSKLPLELNL